VVALVMGVVACASAIDMASTRRICFAVVGFRGYLEVAAIVFLFVRGGKIPGRPRRTGEHRPLHR
jgi:hypothetical protein